MGPQGLGLGRLSAHRVLWGKDMIELAMVLVVVAVAAAAGMPLLRRKFRGQPAQRMDRLDALAAGVFLGFALIHMLPDANRDVARAGLSYPLAPVLCGFMLLGLLALEHFANARVGRPRFQGALLPIVTAAMLSVHAFTSGAALTTSSTFSVTLVLFGAILAHMALSGAILASRLAGSSFGTGRTLGIFAVFLAMFPAGVAAGQVAQTVAGNHPLVEPLASAIAAGAFLYLGTLHGLASTPMIARCHDRRELGLALTGFALMALIALRS